MKTTRTLAVMSILVAAVSPLHAVWPWGGRVTDTGTPVSYFVAPDGADTNAGTREMPFRTLERARDTIRVMKQTGALPEGGVTVYLLPGRYDRGSTFVLEEQDSGTPDAPVIYSGHRNGTAHMIGGRPIPTSAFRFLHGDPVLERLPAVAHAHVMVADLGELGIEDVGKLPEKFRGAAPFSEVFFNGTPLTPAQWPNEGWAEIAEVIDRGVAGAAAEPGSNGIFRYSGDRPSRWHPEQGVWLHGYWCHDWYDETIRVARIDTDSRQIALAARHGYGIGPSHTWNKVPRRWRAVHLLEELDSPGECYIDRESRRLFLWPPGNLFDAEITISVLDDPIVALRNASNITIQKLHIGTTRGDAVLVDGGTGNTVAGCTITNTGRGAVRLSNGHQNRVIGCDISRTGTFGIMISGGDRATLDPAELAAINNHIHHFARRQRTYAAAIHLNGVGNRAAHNLIHDCPHAAVLYGGNNHVIEFNEICLTCQETGDVGALYTGRDWSSLGNVIRHNFIHHTGGVNGWSMGVYLDDCDSGDTIVGNIFCAVSRAAFIGGGRYNTVDNNIFVNCEPAIHVDSRGTSRITWDAGPKDSWDLEAKLKRFRYTEPPWSAAYPYIVDILDDQPELPLHNRITRNVAWGGRWINHRGVDPQLLTMENNLVTAENPGFVSARRMDFRLRKNAEVWAAIPDFEPIPIDRIGPYKDPARASWPVRAPDVDVRLPAPPQDAPAPPPEAVVYRVPRRRSEIIVDAVLDDWSGIDSIELAQGISGQPAAPASEAWLAADRDALYVAFRNTVAAEPDLKTGSTWGQDDAVEVAVEGFAEEHQPAIFVLRGFVNGDWHSSPEAGISGDQAQGAERGVHYAARRVDSRTWVAEWRIPLASLGLRKTRRISLPFNLTVRKTAQNLWLMWQGTGGYSWTVRSAGVIRLP